MQMESFDSNDDVEPRKYNNSHILGADEVEPPQPVFEEAKRMSSHFEKIGTVPHVMEVEDRNANDSAGPGSMATFKVKSSMQTSVEGTDMSKLRYSS